MFEKLSPRPENPAPDDHLEKRLDEIYAKALKLVSEPIDPREFTDYKEVDADVAYVKNRERQFAEQAARMTLVEQNRHKLAAIFEAIVDQQIELGDWLGENACAIKASRFDDIVHGVDTVVEFEEGPASASHLALAVDVTTSAHINDKLKNIKKEIDEGHLTEIKYFKSEHLGFRGRKSNVPRVVVGADYRTIYNLINTWTREDKTGLAAHPLQYKLLMEIKIQLEAFKTYAEIKGKEELAAIYEKTLKIIGEIEKSKTALSREDIEKIEDDVVFQSISAGARNMVSSAKHSAENL